MSFEITPPRDALLLWHLERLIDRSGDLQLVVRVDCKAALLDSGNFPSVCCRSQPLPRSFSTHETSPAVGACELRQKEGTPLPLLTYDVLVRGELNVIGHSDSVRHIPTNDSDYRAMDKSGLTFIPSRRLVLMKISATCRRARYCEKLTS